jgi:hypothetical protein
VPGKLIVRNVEHQEPDSEADVKNYQACQCNLIVQEYHLVLERHYQGTDIAEKEQVAQLQKQPEP